jgi:hypothetical protein
MSHHCSLVALISQQDNRCMRLPLMADSGMAALGDGNVESNIRFCKASWQLSDPKPPFDEGLGVPDPFVSRCFGECRDVVLFHLPEGAQ